MGSVENISSSFVCMVTRANLDSSISCCNICMTYVVSKLNDNYKKDAFTHLEQAA